MPCSSCRRRRPVISRMLYERDPVYRSPEPGTDIVSPKTFIAKLGLKATAITPLMPVSYAWVGTNEQARKSKYQNRISPLSAAVIWTCRSCHLEHVQFQTNNYTFDGFTLLRRIYIGERRIILFKLKFSCFLSVPKYLIQLCEFNYPTIILYCMYIIHIILIFHRHVQ